MAISCDCFDEFGLLAVLAVIEISFLFFSFRGFVALSLSLVIGALMFGASGGRG